MLSKKKVKINQRLNQSVILNRCITVLYKYLGNTRGSQMVYIRSWNAHGFVEIL